MNQVVRDHINAEPGSHGHRFKLVLWLACAICIFAVLYGTSYLALFSLRPYKGVDMRSQLTADYSARAFVVFQPVDPAILEEIRQEQGLPEQMVIDGSLWPTEAGLPTAPSPEMDTRTPIAQATSDDPTSSPIALQLPSSPTSVTTSTTVLPESIVTPQPTQAANPTKSPNPQKTPRRHKTPNPQKPPKSPKPPKQ